MSNNILETSVPRPKQNRRPQPRKHTKDPPLAILVFSTFWHFSAKAPYIFLIFCNRMDVKKLKGSPFTSKFSFSSDIRFCKYISTNVFSNTIRIFDVIPELKRYIRIFDVVSELYCVLLLRRRFKNKCSHLSQYALSELLKRFPNTKGILWVLRNFL